MIDATKFKKAAHCHRRKYGWVPDHPDHRDHKFSAVRRVLASVPAAYNLQSLGLFPDPYDQGQLGSCTANAISGSIQFEQRKQKLTDFMPSRLFLYYNERDMEGSIDQDSGAMIRDGIKSAATLGICEECIWPYDISKFADKPSPDCYKRALVHKAMEYARLDNTNLLELQSCIASNNPFVFGFSVYEGFESEEVATNGDLQLPGRHEELLGGHAVLAVGYDNNTKRFLVRNSWGKSWGQSGYFTIPYDYITNPDLADDFWNISLMEADAGTVPAAA